MLPTRQQWQQLVVIGKTLTFFFGDISIPYKVAEVTIDINYLFSGIFWCIFQVLPQVRALILSRNYIIAPLKSPVN